MPPEERSPGSVWTEAPWADTSWPEQRPGRAHHDLGGVSRFACQSVDPTPHAPSPFDRRVDALRQVLTNHGLLSVDELRRGIESLDPAIQDRSSYYERWLLSMVSILLEKGTISEAALRAELTE